MQAAELRAIDLGEEPVADKSFGYLIVQTCLRSCGGLIVVIHHRWTAGVNEFAVIGPPVAGIPDAVPGAVRSERCSVVRGEASGYRPAQFIVERRIAVHIQVDDRAI